MGAEEAGREEVLGARRVAGLGRTNSSQERSMCACFVFEFFKWSERSIQVATDAATRQVEGGRQPEASDRVGRGPIGDKASQLTQRDGTFGLKAREGAVILSLNADKKLVDEVEGQGLGYFDSPATLCFCEICKAVYKFNRLAKSWRDNEKYRHVIVGEVRRWATLLCPNCELKSVRKSTKP